MLHFPWHSLRILLKLVPACAVFFFLSAEGSRCLIRFGTAGWLPRTSLVLCITWLALSAAVQLSAPPEACIKDVTCVAATTPNIRMHNLSTKLTVVIYLQRVSIEVYRISLRTLECTQQTSLEYVIYDNGSSLSRRAFWFVPCRVYWFCVFLLPFLYRVTSSV